MDILQVPPIVLSITLFNSIKAIEATTEDYMKNLFKVFAILVFSLNSFSVLAFCGKVIDITYSGDMECNRSGGESGNCNLIESATLANTKISDREGHDYITIKSLADSNNILKKNHTYCLGYTHISERLGSVYIVYGKDIFRISEK